MRWYVQDAGERLGIHTTGQGVGGEGVPLWHNKDKSESLDLQGVGGLSIFFFHEKWPENRACERGKKGGLHFNDK